MAAGDIKKPHVDLDPREYSPGAMRTRAVGPGEILVDGDGNPIGGIPAPESDDAALSEITALAEDVENDIAAAIDEAKDYATALVDGVVVEGLDAVLDEAQALVNVAQSDLEDDIAQVASTAEDRAIALSNQAEAEAVATAQASALALVDARAANLESAIDQVASEAEDRAVALSEQAEKEAVATAQADALAAMAAVAADLGEDIDELEDGVAADIDAVEQKLNERIGKLYTMQTVDATPTVIASFSPIYAAQRIIAKITAQRANRLERALYTIEALVRRIPASGILTVSGLPTAGDQVDIGGTTYTFQNVLATAFDVQIGASAQITIDNLVAAINLSGTPGVEYGVGTTAHPSVTAERASASTMDAVAKTPGTAGNAITTTDPIDVGGVLAWGAGTLGGGTDMTVSVVTDNDDYEDDATWDASIAASGSDAEIKVTGAALTVVDWEAEIRIISMV